VNELRAAYAGFHPEVRMVLDACPDCHKWAILERDPLADLEPGQDRPDWRRLPSDDALHGAGAATSIEDAAVLARCLKDVPVEGIEAGIQAFEAHRKAATSKIQEISSANTW